jgi:hypothetical protein
MPASADPRPSKGALVDRIMQLQREQGCLDPAPRTLLETYLYETLELVAIVNMPDFGECDYALCKACKKEYRPAAKHQIYCSTRCRAKTNQQSRAVARNAVRAANRAATRKAR